MGKHGRTTVRGGSVANARKVSGAAAVLQWCRPMLQRWWRSDVGALALGRQGSTWAEQAGSGMRSDCLATGTSQAGGVKEKSGRGSMLPGGYPTQPCRVGTKQPCLDRPQERLGALAEPCCSEMPREHVRRQHVGVWEPTGGGDGCMLPRSGVSFRVFRRLHASPLVRQLFFSIWRHNISTARLNTRLSESLLCFSLPSCDIFMTILHAVRSFKSRDDLGGKLGSSWRTDACIRVRLSFLNPAANPAAGLHHTLLEMELPALFTRSPSCGSSGHGVNDQIAGLDVSAWASLADQQASEAGWNAYKNRRERFAESVRIKPSLQASP